MNGARILAWLLFVAYCVWLFALESWLGSGPSSRWMPDLGFVLVLALLSRAEVADAPFIALAAAVARAAFGPEPPLVLLTGFLIVVFLALTVRRAVELSRPVWRMLAALVFVLVFDAWLSLAQGVRSNGAQHVNAAVLLNAWPAAITSAFVALVLGRALAHLPGLAPIRRRRW